MLLVTECNSYTPWLLWLSTVAGLPEVCSTQGNPPGGQSTTSHLIFKARNLNENLHKFTY